MKPDPLSEDLKLGHEPAFPTDRVSRNSYGDISERTTIPGLTKREHFAGLAMQGMLAGDDGGSSAEYVAQDAVKHADALLKELSK